MHSGRFVFSQLMEHLPAKIFRRCVRRYRGDRRVQSFTCLDPFSCLAFAQLTHRESLRDIEVCLRAHRGKLYHMGIRGGMAQHRAEAGGGGVGGQLAGLTWKHYCRPKRDVGGMMHRKINEIRNSDGIGRA